ncbi:MAG: phenylalanine--tRNA ligase subunit beta [Verrucomicrobia bacterium]|nr:phenylalanine--tRNA ligase subunit beta [Verrucomicrobiota bacterium]
MKISYNWLKEYVDFDWSPQHLAERLTFCGIEVEGVEQIGASFDNVVVAQILASDKHPNADRLSVCRVTDGTAERQIVCGAKNYKVGDKVPLALPGAVLPGDFKIKVGKLRGVESHGMMCSAKELAIAEDAEGLLILDASARVGAPINEILGGGDTVYDLEITPNRPDLLSIIGIAREVSALTGNPIKWPQVNFTEEETPVESLAKVRVEAPDLCPRYAARLVRGVKIGPSPDWLKTLLEKLGVRSINNVVDVTNLVLLEIGQPLHAFDYNLVAGHEIVVRRAQAGECIMTIDGKNRTLDEQMLVIADGQKPVALAGVMGGQHSEINDRTVDVLLESAYFFPPNIRRTSKRIGLSSESSYRFERGADIGIADWASRRAIALIQQLAGGKVARGVIDTLAKPVEKRRIACRYARVNHLLGVEVPPDASKRALAGLGLNIVSESADRAEFEVPTFRVDLQREVDLIEEIGRVHGLDKIPSVASHAMPATSQFDATFDQVRLVRQILNGLGFEEAINQTMTSPTAAALTPLAEGCSLVKLQNPLNEDLSVLRPSLLPGLLQNLRVNVSRQTLDARLFEIGRVFASEKGVHEEQLSLGLAVTGAREPGAWEADARAAKLDYYDLKGAVESLLARLRIGPVEFLPVENSQGLFEQSAQVGIGGDLFGVVGVLDAAVARQFDLRDPVLLAELDLADLLAKARGGGSYKPLPQFPAVQRDIAMIVDAAATHAQVMAAIASCRKNLVESVGVFDIFAGGTIPKGKKSVAYSLTYRAPDRTLTDAEVNRMHDEIKATLKKSLQCEIREE